MPSTGRYLLDTNIVIALFEADAEVLSRLDLAAQVFISAIVIGELLFGAAKSGRSAQNTAKVERFAAACPLLPCNLEVAREYGRLRNQLRAKGRPIPENDIWIAATATCHGLVLVTRDQHFAAVEDLALENW
jgi:tRNA(fMet)-specific endonuclease VapC